MGVGDGSEDAEDELIGKQGGEVCADSTGSRLRRGIFWGYGLVTGRHLEGYMFEGFDGEPEAGPSPQTVVVHLGFRQRNRAAAVGMELGEGVVLRRCIPPRDASLLSKRARATV